MPPKTFAFASLLGVAALSLAGYSAAAAPNTHKEGRTQNISLVANGGTHLFITPAGQTLPFPTGPLAPGTRILGSDSITEDGAAVAHDFEQCSVTFNRNVLCDDTVRFAGRSQLRIGWTFQWPSTGTSGPSNWNGEIMGGSGSCDGARGEFHAVAEPDGSDRITGTFTTTS
jgi:hypothetical protein